MPAVISTGARTGPSIAYLGLPAGQTNILQLLEHQRDPSAPAHRRRATVRWRDLRSGHWPDADLVVVGAERSRIVSLPPVCALVAPFRVHLVVDVGTGPDAVSGNISRRERWEFRRNRAQHDWRLEHTSDPEALEFFYHRMHLPTMRARHGERSRSESIVAAREAILRYGCLFFVQEGGRRVAGALCQVSTNGHTITTRLLGVLDGEDEHYRSGAFKAVYHLLLDWAARHGAAEVDFFGTEALVSKGIFQWKRKFHPRVVLPPNHFATKQILLRVQHDTPAVRDFLVANPLLTSVGPHLQPVYFTDATRPARTEISAACPGLPDPVVLDLDEFLTGSGDAR